MSKPLGQLAATPRQRPTLWASAYIGALAVGLLAVFLLIAVLTAGKARAQTLSEPLGGASQALSEPSGGLSAGAAEPQGTASGVAEEPARQAPEGGAAEPVAVPGQGTTADPVTGSAQETVGPASAPTQKATAPVLSVSVGDQRPAPAAAPVQRPAPAAAPVEETVEPVVAPVEQTLEPAVAPVRTSVHETVDPVVAPVQETIEPVVAPVQETAEPVRPPVEETVGPVREVVEPVAAQDASLSPAPIQESAEPVTTPALEAAKPVATPEPVVEPVRTAAEAVPAQEPETSAFEGESVRQQDLSALPSASPVAGTVSEVALPDHGTLPTDFATSGGFTDPILTSKRAEPLPVKVSSLAVALGAAIAVSDAGTNVLGRAPQQSPYTAVPLAGSLSGGSGSGGYAGVGILISFFVLLWAGKLLLTRPEYEYLRPNSVLLSAIERPG